MVEEYVSFTPYSVDLLILSYSLSLAQIYVCGHGKGRRHIRHSGQMSVDHDLLATVQTLPFQVTLFNYGFKFVCHWLPQT